MIAMKNIKLSWFAILIFILIASCTARKEQKTSTDAMHPERDAFHMTMAEAYHPFKDSGDLAPAKKLAVQLANEAERWADAPIPKSGEKEKDEFKEKLSKLKEDSRAFADHVSSGVSNEQLGKELTELHEEFHALMEKD